MDPYCKSNEKAVFIAESKERKNLLEDLMLGRLSAGQFEKREKGINQFLRIKSKLSEVPGLVMLTFPGHLTALRIEKNVYTDVHAMTTLIKELKLIEKSLEAGDKLLFSEIVSTVRRLAGDGVVDDELLTYPQLA